MSNQTTEQKKWTKESTAFKNAVESLPGVPVLITKETKLHDNTSKNTPKNR